MGLLGAISATLMVKLGVSTLVAILVSMGIGVVVLVFYLYSIGKQYRVKTDDFVKWWNGRVQQTQKNILKGCLPG